MPKRIAGKPKKKSIKAALDSYAGKRKLSRMGKKQKKHKGGLEATFIGRSKCLKLLQVSLRDFRRLCILKGIYPRDPRGKFPNKDKSQVYYHKKDIKSIAHEPILNKFREFKAYIKKVHRAAGRREFGEAARKTDLIPQYTVHHLVKERYPRFIDALGDLDDALTLTYLFAALPTQRGIKSSVIKKSKTIVAAWGAYCATTNAITKSFISIKGVYLEAQIMEGTTPIRWIVPHPFTQHLPKEVDFRVMLTFLEFYETLLNFVLFKLYSDINVRYPFPVTDAGKHAVGSTSELLGQNLRALTNALKSPSDAISDALAGPGNKDKANSKSTKGGTKSTADLQDSVNQALSTIQDEEEEDEEDSDDEENNDDDDDLDNKVDIATPLREALEENAKENYGSSDLVPGGGMIEDDESVKRKRLFQGLTFFLSREVPRGYLELVCLAYGGQVGWEGNDSMIAMKDLSITHHIVDRPRLVDSYSTLPKNREYVQPQWILDCTNNMFLLPISRYAVGVTLPPHLSPWVDHEEEGYKPAYAEEIERMKNGEPDVEVGSDNMEEEDKAEQSGDVEATESIEEMIDEDDEKAKPSTTTTSDDEVEVEDEEEPVESVTKRQEKKRKAEEEEAHELAKNMMSRKAKSLYGRMQHGISQKKAKADALQQKRKELDAIKKKDPEGRTTRKQQVDRLSIERKIVEDAYTNTGGSMKKSKGRKKK